MTDDYEPLVYDGRSIEFRVYGDPAPQGSKKILKTKRGKRIMVESSKKVKPWRQVVAEVAAIYGWADPIKEGPIRVEITFYKRPPKSPKWKRLGLPETQPDLDKLERSTHDALSGVLYGDDRQIAESFTRKRFGAPGALIKVTELLESANRKKKDLITKLYY